MSSRSASGVPSRASRPTAYTRRLTEHSSSRSITPRRIRTRSVSTRRRTDVSASCCTDSSSQCSGSWLLRDFEIRTPSNCSSSRANASVNFDRSAASIAAAIVSTASGSCRDIASASESSAGPMAAASVSKAGTITWARLSHAVDKATARLSHATDMAAAALSHATDALSHAAPRASSDWRSTSWAARGVALLGHLSKDPEAQLARVVDAAGIQLVVRHAVRNILQHVVQKHDRLFQLALPVAGEGFPVEGIAEVPTLGVPRAVAPELPGSVRPPRLVDQRPRREEDPFLGTHFLGGTHSLGGEARVSRCGDGPGGHRRCVRRQEERQELQRPARVHLRSNAGGIPSAGLPRTAPAIISFRPRIIVDFMLVISLPPPFVNPFTSVIRVTAARSRRPCSRPAAA